MVNLDHLPPTCNGLCAADEPHRTPCPLALDTLPPLEPALMPATISARAARYRTELDAAYAEHPELPVGVLEAVGDRETLWTEAEEYRLADGTQARGRPDGTGDWAPRWGAASPEMSRLIVCGVVRVTGRRCLPSDGLGWGRGLMQVDLAAHSAFCANTCPGSPGHAGGATRAWACARCNIVYAAGVLAAGLKQAGGYLPEAICAYNAGWGGVERAREATAAWERLHRVSASEADRVRVLDSVTTGGNYVSNVIDRMRELNAASSGL